MPSSHAFSSDFDPEAFDVEWFDGVPGQGETWAAAVQQPDIWTPKAKQSETWTRNYDE